MTNRRTGEYRARLDAAGAQWSGDDGEVARLEEGLGELMAQCEAARVGLALGDRSERELLAIEGADAITWFQGLFTHDVMTLAAPGSGQRTHAVSRLGRAIADARALHIEDMLLLDLEPGTLRPALWEHLHHHIIMEDVTLHDRGAHTARLTLWGPQAASLLRARGVFAHDPGSLTGHNGTSGRLAGHDVILWHLPWGQTPGIEVVCAREAAVSVFDALHTWHPQPVLIGARAVELLRIDAGVPRFMVDYDDKTIPIEADLNETISYTKGCYLGQEVIHRLDTRGKPAKLLRALRLPHPVPAHAPVLVEDKQVGELLGCWPSPTRGDYVAWAYLKRGAYDAGQPVVVRDEADEVAAIVAPLR